MNETRCGRCLAPVGAKTFLHDCAGDGLEAAHYVKRLEGELGRLGEWLSQNTQISGGISAVDAAITYIKELEK